jgi:hypothetical protein
MPGTGVCVCLLAVVGREGSREEREVTETSTIEIEAWSAPQEKNCATWARGAEATQAMQT